MKYITVLMLFILTSCKYRIENKADYLNTTKYEIWDKSLDVKVLYCFPSYTSFQRTIIVGRDANNQIYTFIDIDFYSRIKKGKKIKIEPYPYPLPKDLEYVWFGHPNTQTRSKKSKKILSTQKTVFLCRIVTH